MISGHCSASGHKGCEKRRCRYPPCIALMALQPFDFIQLSWPLKSGRSENSPRSDHTLKESVAPPSSRRLISSSVRPAATTCARDPSRPRKSRSCSGPIMIVTRFSGPIPRRASSSATCPAVLSIISIPAIEPPFWKTGEAPCHAHKLQRFH